MSEIKSIEPSKNTGLFFGCMADKIWMTDDFDVLPDEFEEYIVCAIMGDNYDQ